MEDQKKDNSQEVIPGRRPIYFVAETTFVPPTDVWETETCFYILLEIANLDLDNCSAKYLNGFIIIEGCRKIPQPEESVRKYHKKEIEKGNFCVKVKMNTRIEQTKMQATYKDGFLMLELTKNFERKSDAYIEIPLKS